MPQKHLFIAVPVLALSIGFNLETYAFNIGNFGKVFENLSGTSSGVSKKRGKAAENNSNTGDSNGNQSGSNEEFLNYTCSSYTPDDEWLHDSSPTVLKSFENIVARDFGKSAPNTQNILYSFKTNGMAWAQDIKFYKEGFNASAVKLLFNNFLKIPLRRLEIAGKIKHAITHEDLEEAEQNDARFAYALILAHYSKYHTRQAYQEKILEQAFQGDALGAVYVFGYRLYHGIDGVTQNVKKAAGYLTTTDGWKNQEDDEWQGLMDLWYKVAVDPRNPHHRQNREFAADAARADARFKRKIARGKRGATSYAKIVAGKMADYRMQSGTLLSQAFGYADKQAELTEQYQDLLNQADQSQQVVEKKVSISMRTVSLAKEMIGQTQKELDPEGKKKLKRARDINKHILHMMKMQFWTGSLSLSQMGAGGDNMLTTMIAMASEMDNAKMMSCELHTSLTNYASRKKVKVDGAPIVTIAEEQNMFKKPN